MEDFIMNHLELEVKYPTDEELSVVENWDVEHGDISNLIRFIENIWQWADWGVKKRFGFSYPIRRKVLKLELHTGGWSGNEDIINALKRSMFWDLYWEKSVRGGHFYFEIPIKHLNRSKNKLLKN